MAQPRILLRRQLQLVFSLLMLLVAANAVLGILTEMRSARRFDLYVNGTQRTLLANEFFSAIQARAIAARNLVLVTTAADVAQEKLVVERTHTTVKRTLESLQKKKQEQGANATLSDLLDKVAATEEKYGPVAMRIVQLALEDNHAQAVAMMNDQCPVAGRADRTHACVPELQRRTSQCGRDDQSGGFPALDHYSGHCVVHRSGSLGLSGRRDSPWR